MNSYIDGDLAYVFPWAGPQIVSLTFFCVSRRGFPGYLLALVE